MKMPIWFKIIWIVPILINIAALIWFIVGSTGGFQRGHDIVASAVLIGVWNSFYHHIVNINDPHTTRVGSV